MKRQVKLKKQLLFNAIGIASFFVFWQVMSKVLNNPAVPSAADVLRSMFEILKNGNALTNILATLKLVLIGVFMAFIVGFLLGLVCEASTTINGLLMPILGGARNIAAISLFPLLIVLFGIGDFPRIVVIFWTAFPAIMLSTIKGLNSIEISLIEAGQNLGANTWQMYRYIKVPLALPQILNGLRIGIGNGFIAIVVAEMLGSSKGLGFMVLWTTQSFKYKETYAYIVIIAIVGGLINLTMNYFIKKIERKIL